MRAHEFLLEYRTYKTEQFLKRWQQDGFAFKDQIGENGENWIAWLEQYDPTQQKKYVNWMITRYLKNDIKRLEDIPARIRPALAIYDKLARTKKLQPEHKDIGRIKNLEDVVDVYTQAMSQDDMQSGKEQKAQAKSEGIDVIIKEPGLQVLHTKTHEANCLVGKGTRWCTASKDDSNYFDDYSKDGPLYTIIAGDGANQKKYQFHYESNQFLNARDEAVEQSDIAMLSKYPGWAKFLNMQIKQHYGEYFKEAA